jgi:nucleotide-binding universal stress UspA family protein
MRQAENLAAYAWNETERRIKRIADEHGVSIAIRRESGRVVDVLVGAGKAASLILLGRRGCRPDHRGLLGSNAELVVRRTHKPVLLAPVEFRAPQKVLVAYGGKDMGALALEMGVVIADTVQLPLSILTVERDERRREEIRHRARQHQPGLGDRASFDHDTGEPAAAILGRAVPDTLVIMGAYGHSRLHRMVLGSTTEQVIHACGGPLLLSRK